MSKTSGGDLASYVKHSDGPMTSSNYNEIDGLVFSSVAYTKFESSKVTWTESELENGISMQQFAKRMLDTDKACGGTLLASEDQRALLEAIQNSDRYENCMVNDLAACKGTEIWDAGKNSTISDDAQWAAMTIDIKDGTNTSVVAMRGTDGTTLGWNEDFELGYEAGGTTAQKLSRDYLAACDADKIALVGHSKGGNDVVSAYVMSEKSVRDRVFEINNYDGPGSNYKFIKNYKEGYSELDSKLNNYYPKNSVVGQLLNDNPGKHYYCEADVKGHTEDMGIMGEHDPYSWEFEKKGTLDNTKQGDVSKILNRVLDNTLKGLNNTEAVLVLRTFIQIGIPELIATHQIDYSTWQKLFMSLMQHPFTSVEQYWATMRTMYRLLYELACEGVAFTFPLPYEAEFYAWLRGLSADIFRNFKDAAEKLWDMFVSKVNPFSSRKNTKGKEHKNSSVYNFNNNRRSGTAGPAIFFIDVEKLISCAEHLVAVASMMKTQVSELDSIISDVNASGLGNVTPYLKAEKTRADTKAGNIAALGRSLSSIYKIYRDTESAIVSNYSS